MATVGPDPRMRLDQRLIGTFRHKATRLLAVRVETLGKDPDTKRALYLLTLEKVGDFSAALDIPEAGFICLLAWDAAGVPDELVTRVAKVLLDAGASYVCTWGSDCERVHDLVDQAAFDPDADYDVDPVIMTTWHDDEPLEEAIYFALTDANPDDDYADDCTGTVAVSIGNAKHAETIRSALSDPAAFRARILEEEDRNEGEGK